MFSEQLKKYRKKLNLTQEALAHRVTEVHGLECTGLNIGSYEKGTNPKVDMIIALADILNIPEQLLFDDSKSKINKIVDMEIPNFKSFTEHTKKVPLVDGYIGAGSAGHLLDEVNVIDYLYVDNYTIQKPFRNSNIKALIVVGDSMQGYVDNADIILFTEITDRTYNLTDGKYIITTINGTMVKNLTFKCNGDIVISSCNKAYEKELIKSSESQEYLDIIGVVVGRILKN